MIYYKVLFRTLHVHFKGEDLLEAMRLFAKDNQAAQAEEQALQDRLLSWGEAYTEFNEPQPIEARKKAFAFVDTMVNELLSTGEYVPSHEFTRSLKPDEKTYSFTIFCCWDGNAIPVATPVNTPDIQQYKAAEYALYQTYGFDIGSEAPATEFIPELVRTIEVIPS